VSGSEPISAPAPSAQKRLPAPPLAPGLLALAAATIYLIVLLAAERQAFIIGLLVLGIATVLVASRLGLLDIIAPSFAAHEDALGGFAVVAALAVAAYFHDEHFVLLLLVTVLLYSVATLGLNVQFGYAGVLNFAGASFFGIGAYTSAVLNGHTALPSLVILLVGGALAALVGSLLLLPVLRTRGHYAAVVTIAFALLFKTFLEVNDVLGGPQGMQVKGMSVLGWSLNDNIEIGGLTLSFYLGYFALSLLLLVIGFVLVRRLERSWIGLNLDALRLDETAAGCFGLDVARWQITAFLIGNFLIGIAGALFGMVGGFVAPNNYTFADSLILVSILLLGGIGNPWGVVAATVIVVVVPEKLQTIQEYRFLLYALMVIAVLLFRPQGLLPRPVRRYFPDWRP
jgi:ABC-type branched-subunit amino acid transport system permease subunit